MPFTIFAGDGPQNKQVNPMNKDMENTFNQMAELGGSDERLGTNTTPIINAPLLPMNTRRAAPVDGLEAAKTIQEITDQLRAASCHEIGLPKGVVVGLLVAIEDALSRLHYVKTIEKTKKHQRACSSAISALEGSRDRLLRAVKGDAR